MVNYFVEIQLGNPETHYPDDWRGLVDYAWSHAIVSEETYTIITENCNFYSGDPWINNNCSLAVGKVFEQYKLIDMYSLYTEVCTKTSDSLDYTTTQVLFNPTSNMVSDQ